MIPIRIKLGKHSKDNFFRIAIRYSQSSLVLEGDRWNGRAGGNVNKASRCPLMGQPLNSDTINSIPNAMIFALEKDIYDLAAKIGGRSPGVTL